MGGASSMKKPVIIIVSGPPASGKTTLAKQIATKFGLPIVHKDDLKELLFEAFEYRSREQSSKLGATSMQLLYFFTETLVKAGQSLIVESNFNADIATQEFVNIKKKYDFEPFQIQCKTDGEVLLQRFQARSQTGERHSAHFDKAYYEESRQVLLKGRHDNLGIGGSLFEVDTTDFNKIDYKSLFGAIRASLQENKSL